MIINDKGNNKFYSYISVTYIFSSSFDDCSQWQPESSFFNSCYSKVLGRMLLLPLDHSH